MRGLVADERPKPHLILAGFSRVGKPSLTHKGDNLLLSAELKALGGLKQTPERETGGRLHHIDEMKRAAGPQHAAHFAERCFFLLVRKKAENVAEHAVEGGVGIGKLVRKTPVEVDLNAGALGFACCAGERPGIGIEADDGDAWMKLLDKHGQGAGAATDIEEALAGRKLHPLNKRTLDRVTAQQLGQRIVDGQSPVPPRRGEIGSFRSHGLLTVAGLCSSQQNKEAETLLPFYIGKSDIILNSD